MKPINFLFLIIHAIIMRIGSFFELSLKYLIVYTIHLINKPVYWFCMFLLRTRVSWAITLYLRITRRWLNLLISTANETASDC